MSFSAVEHCLAMADNLIAQCRHSDALPLLESALSITVEAHQSHDHHLEHRPSQNPHQHRNEDTSSENHMDKFSTIVIKYAKCLVNLQRFEAALFVIESCHSTKQQLLLQQHRLHSAARNSDDSTTAAADDAKNQSQRQNHPHFAALPPSAVVQGMFNSNSTFVTSAVVAGVVDPAPPRCLTDEGPEGLTRKLSADAIGIALECALALHDWGRTKLYANSLLYLDASSCTALLALGKLACSNASPADAASFLVRALRADPFCSTALDMIVDNWLLPTAETEQLVLSLDFSSSSSWSSSSLPSSSSSSSSSTAAAATAGEIVRNMYLARIPDAAVQLISSEGVPLWLRNYHEAIVLLEANDLDGAIRCSSNALSGTPIKQYVACLHLSVLTQTHETATLFRFAHLLSESFPSSAVSFYAAGCYYFSIGSFERAGRLFSRATDLDPLFAEAWIAYGHCYARLEEGEQALAAYRRAQNLFPGLHQCDLFLGIQYARQHSAQLALACLENAHRGSRVRQQQRRQQQQQQQQEQQQVPSLSSDDVVTSALDSSNTASGLLNLHQPQSDATTSILPPSTLISSSSYEALLLNETAVLYFRSKQYAAALQLLVRARDALPNKERPADHEVCILFNLASAFRKVNYLDLAATTYLEFIRLRPQASIGHCAYGFTLHLQGQLDAAISSYRTSLALRRDAFCRDLLERALEERHGSGYFNSFPGGIDGWLSNNNNDGGKNRSNTNSSNDANNGNDDAAQPGGGQNVGHYFFDPTGTSFLNPALASQNHHHSQHHHQQQQRQASSAFSNIAPAPAATAAAAPTYNHHHHHHHHHPSPAPYHHHNNHHSHFQHQHQHHHSAGSVAALNFVFDPTLLPAAVVGGGHTGRGTSIASTANNSADQQQQQEQPRDSSASIQRPSFHQSPRPTISRALSFQ